MAEQYQLSPITGNKVPTHYLHASSAFFRDTKGRAVFLRGINFSGSAKAPVGQPSQQVDGLWESAQKGGQSFVGQPLDLQDGSADAHLRRLRTWGFNCFRYVFTWEALEHEGPGKYDYEYMDYVVAVLRRCKAHGFRVYMDPHQDIFSRFTGGSGAPYWVLPACGIDHRGLTPTQAAFLHSEWPNSQQPDPASFPDMLWATNYTRLAPATLSVLFFAGHDYAPRCKLDGKPISEWLQDHFLAACKELAIRIRDAGDLNDECVIGWDSLNEPNQTYIGLESVDKLPEKWKLRQGPMPSPLQSMALGIGQAQRVQNWVFSSLGPKKAGDVTVDPHGSSIWMTPADDAEQGGSKWGWTRDPDWPLGECVWASHGVWDIQSGKAVRPDYFAKHRNDRPVEFVEDYWLPFWRKYAATIRSVHPEAIMFIQPPVFEPPPRGLNAADLQGRACVSCHFYDGLTLITKHWNWYNADAVGLLRGKYSALIFALRFGAKAVRKVVRDQLGYLRADTLDVLGQYPTIVGEIGVPFDLDKKRSYYGDAKGKGIGDYQDQTKALDASLNACDGTNLLSYTMWTYCPDNTHAWGDNWNGEDLSIFSLDDRKAAVSEPSTVTSKSSALTLSDQDILEETPKDSSRSNAAVQSGEGSSYDLCTGSRSASAFWRPYPIAVAGDPVQIDFDIISSRFSFIFETTAEQSAIDAPTEVFLPLIHYAKDATLSAVLSGQRRGHVSDGRSQDLVSDADLPELDIKVTVSSGRWEVSGQVLKWWLDGEGSASAGAGTRRDGIVRHEITVERRGGATAAMRASAKPSSMLEQLSCNVM